MRGDLIMMGASAFGVAWALIDLFRWWRGRPLVHADFAGVILHAAIPIMVGLAAMLICVIFETIGGALYWVGF